MRRFLDDGPCWDRTSDLPSAALRAAKERCGASRRAPLVQPLELTGPRGRVRRPPLAVEAPGRDRSQSPRLSE
jgi:hypothetical protein